MSLKHKSQKMNLCQRCKKEASTGDYGLGLTCRKILVRRLRLRRYSEGEVHILICRISKKIICQQIKYDTICPKVTCEYCEYFSRKTCNLEEHINKKAE